MPQSMTLPEVADFYGISREDLLLYEAEGLVTPLRVGNDRYYTQRHHVIIEIISKGKALGFVLSEIKVLVLAHLPPAARPVTETRQTGRQIERIEDGKDGLLTAINHLQTNIDHSRVKAKQKA